MRNYRIVRLTMILHGLAAEAFYRSNPGRAALPYEQQREALIDGGYFHFNGFARQMRELGNDAHDIICDVEPLQKTWAKENGFQFNPDKWQVQIALRQIEVIRPDVLYFQDVVAFPDALRRDLKNRFPFLKRVIVYKASASVPQSLADADMFFLGTPRFVADFAQHKLHGDLVYHAFDETLLQRLPEPVTRQHDFTFLGSAGTGFGWTHRARFWTLYELARCTPLEMWIFDKREKRDDPTYTWGRRIRTSLRPTIKMSMKALPTAVLRGIAQNDTINTKIRWVAEEIATERRWRSIPFGSLPPAEPSTFPVMPLTALFPGRTHPPRFGPDMFEILRSSKLTFHQHGDVVMNGNSVGAVRLFEATGMGACLVTDFAPNLTDLFEPNRDVVAYTSTAECVEKVQYLLDHEAECRQIAEAGHRRTLRDHTVAKRCQQIHDLIARRL